MNWFTLLKTVDELVNSDHRKLLTDVLYANPMDSHPGEQYWQSFFG